MLITVVRSSVNGAAEGRVGVGWIRDYIVGTITSARGRKYLLRHDR